MNKKLENKALVTVVTVCYNAEATIEETLVNVLTQTYRPLEYLIVDGKSSDKTIDIVRKLEQRFKEENILLSVISEKDTGIYDAMNKGAAMAHGDWLIYMNSGDTFYNEQTIACVFDSLVPEDVKCVYGDMERKMNCGTFIDKAHSLEHLQKGMAFSHQSAFIRTSEMKLYPYNLEYRLAADFCFFHELYKRNGKFQYVPVVVSYGLDGGVSSLNRRQVDVEYARILGQNTNFLFILRSYFKQFSRGMKKGMQSIFPDEMVQKIRRWNYERRSRRKKR